MAEENQKRFSQLKKKFQTDGLNDAEFEEYKVEADKFDRPYSAAAAGAGSAVTLGLSDVAGAALGYGDDLRNLKEFNPTATTVGEVAGTVGSAVAGPLSAITKGTERVLAKSIINQAGKDTLGKAVARGTIREGVEGGVVGVGQTISDVALSEKSYTPMDVAESLIANVGMGFVVGGGIGAGLGASGRAARGIKGAIKKPTAAAQEFTEDVVVSPRLGGVEVEEAFPRVTGNVEYSGSSINDAVPTGEMQAKALSELGVDANQAKELSSNWFARQAEDTGTIASNIQARTKANFQKRIAEDFTTTAKPEIDLSMKEIGADFKKIVLEDIEANKARFSELYGAEKTDLSKIKLNKGQNADGARFIRRSNAYKELSNSPAKRKAKELEKLFEKSSFKTATQIDREISKIKGLARDAVKNPDEAYTYSNLAQQLSKFKERLVERKVLSATGGDTKAARQILQSRKDLNTSYREYAQDLANISGIGKKVELKSPAQVETFINSLSDEEVGKKFLENNIKNADNLLSLKERLPQQFENMRKKYVSDLLIDSVTKDELDLSKLVKKTKKIGPEARELIFGPEAARTLNNLDILARGNGDLLVTKRKMETGYKGVIATMTSELKDAVFLALSKAMGIVDNAKLPAASAEGTQLMKKGLIIDPKVRGAVQGTESKIKNSINKFLKGIKDTTKGIPAGAVKSSLGTQEENKERIDQYYSYATDPNKYVDPILQNTRGIYARSPEVADAMMNSAMESVNFLISKLPKGEVGFDQEVLGKPVDYSDYQVSTFSRYAKAVEDPLSILDDIQAGTLTPQAIESVRTIYPSIMHEIQAQTLDTLSKGELNLNYGQKIQLSMLLGFPVSATMKPGFIARMQAGGQQQQQQPQVKSSASLDVAQNYETPQQRIQTMS